jgi:hypothetical protein
MITLPAEFSSEGPHPAGSAPGRQPEHAQPVRWALVALARAAVRAGRYDRPGLADRAVARAVRGPREASRTRVPGLLAGQSPARPARPDHRGSIR